MPPKIQKFMQISAMNHGFLNIYQLISIAFIAPIEVPATTSKILCLFKGFAMSWSFLIQKYSISYTPASYAPSAPPPCKTKTLWALLLSLLLLLLEPHPLFIHSFRSLPFLSAIHLNTIHQ